MNLHQAFLLLGVFLCHLLPACSRSSVRRLSVPHNALPGHVITLLPLVGERKYRLVDASGEGLERLFSLMTSGELMTTRQVAPYEGRAVTLVVEQTEPRVQTAHVVNMDIKQVPAGMHLGGQPYVGHITENLPAGAEVTTLQTLTAAIRKLPPSTTLELLSGDTEVFQLSVTGEADQREAHLATRWPLDREATPHFRLLLRAHCPSLLDDAFALISVMVDDVNDNRPVFDKDLYTGVVPKDAKPLDVLLRVQASDADGEPVEYSMEDANRINDIFTVDPVTGDVLLQDPTKVRERDFEVAVFARDFRGTDKVKATVRITGFDDDNRNRISKSRTRRAIRDPRVFVINRNDTGAVFSVAPPAGVAEERYAIKEPFPQNLRMRAETGVVSVAGPWTDMGDVQIVVNVTRVDDPLYQDDHPVTIVLVDRSTSAPLFTNTPRPMRTYVPTWIRPDTPIYTLEALDAKVHGAQVEYKLETGGEGRFMVDPLSGEVRTLLRRPFEWCTRYDLAVSARVVGAVRSTQTPTQVLEVHCGFLPPQFYEEKYVVDMNEYQDPSQDPVATIRAKSFYDIPIEYSVQSANSSLPLVFRIDRASGALRPTPGRMSYLTDRRQHRLLVTATEPASGFFSNVSVVVNLVDVNDQAPYFMPDVYVRRDMLEDAPLGSAVLTVSAVDRDVGDNARLSFNVSDDHFRIEQLDNNRATIVVNKRLDYDRLQNRRYELTVTATDAGTPPLSGTAVVRVWMKNVDDHPPVLEPVHQKVYVKERAPQNTLVHVVQAYDPDGNDITFSFANNALTYEDTFRIDRITGYITLTQDLASSIKRKNITVEVRDERNQVGRGKVVIDFIGVNRPPAFPECTKLNAQLFEGRPAGTGVINITAVDPDSGSNGELTFTILDQPNRKSLFKIRQVGDSSAEVVSLEQLDREDPDSEADYYIVGNQLKYSVIVKVTDNGRPRLSTTCFFLITVKDMNDQLPRFDSDSYLVNIPESPPQNTKLLQVYASDLDESNNGLVTYTISTQSSNCPNCFSIHPQTGWITNVQRLENINTQTLILNVTATDGGNPSLATHVQVKLVRSGELPPEWQPVNGLDIDELTITIPENTDIGKLVGPSMTALPQDAAETVLFFIVRGRYNNLNRESDFVSFEIKNEQNTMKIKVGNRLDFEKTPNYILQLRASYLDQNALRSDTYVRLSLTDVNDHVPLFIGQDENGAFPAAVSEESPAGAIVASVFAVDKDGTSPYNEVRYYFDSECGTDCEMFLIDDRTGEIRSKDKFQRTNSKSRYNLFVIAMDGRVGDPMCNPPTNVTNCRNRSPSRAPVTVDVLSSSMSPPYFKSPEYPLEVQEGFKFEQFVGKVDAINPEPNLTYVQYGIIGGNTRHTFAVQFDTGIIYQVGEVQYDDNPYRLQYRVFDGQVQNTTTVRITVQPRHVYPPRFTVTGPEPLYTVSAVTEGSKDISFIQEIEAVDPTGRSAGIVYGLAGRLYEEDRSRFEIRTEDNKATVYLNKVLDRDYPLGHADWQLNVVAGYENTMPGQDDVKGYALLNIRPQDVDDSTPVFDVCCLEGMVAEDATIGTSVLRVSAVDYDEDQTVTFTLVGGDTDVLSIDSQGTVRTADGLDREVQDMHSVIVRATDNAGHTVDETIWITVTDVNDNGPSFPQTQYEVLIPEGLPVGSSVLTVSASDPDVGENARREYTVVNLNRESQHFYMDSILSTGVGVIKINQLVDFETMGFRKSLMFNVEVQGPKSTDRDQAQVNVTVYDVNDNAPVISPPTQTVQVSEADPVGTLIAGLNATDADMGDNKMFTWALDYRNSDQTKRFFINPETGVISVYRKLDRETTAIHTLTVHCIDKGTPPLTGSAVVVVEVTDVNEHAPQFAPRRRPRVRVNPAVNSEVATLKVIDLDSPDNGPPFTVEVDCDDTVNLKFCEDFSFKYNSAGDGTTNALVGSTPDINEFVISTKKGSYERTDTFKFYRASVRMTDSGSPPQTALRDLYIDVQDVNDHPHSAGTKVVQVYNYKGLFNDVSLGRVYAADVDDWDAAEKTYDFVPDQDTEGFRLESDGTLKMDLGVSPGQHRLDVVVEDRQAKTVSEVIVNVIYITDEIVMNSGSIRLSGLSPKEFIEPEAVPGGDSRMGQLKQTLAEILGTKVEYVTIFTVLPVEGEDRQVEVRYAAHGSPYYRPARLNGLAWANKDKIADSLTTSDRPVGVVMAPVDLCLDELCFDGGCTNQLVVENTAATVHTNTTSMVGVNAYVQAVCQCEAAMLDVRENPEMCTDTSCYNNGTCMETMGGVACECPFGYDGPRCQQLKVQFVGNGWAWYKPLSQCEDGALSLQFATTALSGVLLYTGPLHDTADLDLRDFLLLELANGYPRLRVNLGTGEARAVLNGQNRDSKRVMEPLNDGHWHTIEIFKNGKVFRLVVDHCETAEIVENINSTSEDRASCEADLETPGLNFLLNVNTPLQLGGRSHTPNYPRTVMTDGFSGCVKELRYNGELYDLHIGNVGESSNTEDGCGKEGLLVIGPDGSLTDPSPNSTCVGNLVDDTKKCTCKPGRFGRDCDQTSKTRDLQSNQSFLQWRLKDGYNDTLSKRQSFLQLMFRTRRTDARLFHAASFSTLERLFIDLVNGSLYLTYDLGSGDRTVGLPYITVSDGEWHVVYVRRYGNQAVLAVDGGEGRAYNQTEPDHGFRLISLSGKDVFGGAHVVYRPFHDDPDVNNVLVDSCVTDVRYNEDWFPMVRDDNAESVAADLTEERNVDVGCKDPDLCVGGSVPCTQPQVCVHSWRLAFCGCAADFYPVPTAPYCAPIVDCSLRKCVHGICIPTMSGHRCHCDDGWFGDYCDTKEAEPIVGPVAGITGGAIAAIVACLLLLLLLILLAACFVKYRQKPVPLLVMEPDDDVRDNVVFYDEEGAGEEDQQAYDITRLQKPMDPDADSATKGPYDEEPPYRNDVLPLTSAEPMPEPRYPPFLSPDGPGGKVPNIGNFIDGRLEDADVDPNAPPYDSVREYQYEGSGSLAGSLSSLQSSSSGDQDYDYLNDWGPRFQKLADLYGGGDGDDEDEEEDDEEDASNV